MLEIRRLEKVYGGIGFFAELGCGTWDHLPPTPALSSRSWWLEPSIVWRVIVALRFRPTDAKVWSA